MQTCEWQNYSIYLLIYSFFWVYSFSAELSRHIMQTATTWDHAMDAVHQLRQYYADHLHSDEKWEEIWRQSARNFLINWTRSGNARTSKSSNKLDQSTTATALHQFQDIKTKCKWAGWPPGCRTRPQLQPAWHEQAACDWACADGDSAARWHRCHHEFIFSLHYL